MTFTLNQREDGMWEATADPCAFHFDTYHTTATGGFSVANSDRAACVEGILGMFVKLMIEPLANAGG